MSDVTLATELKPTECGRYAPAFKNTAQFMLVTFSAFVAFACNQAVSSSIDQWAPDRLINTKIKIVIAIVLLSVFLALCVSYTNLL